MRDIEGGRCGRRVPDIGDGIGTVAGGKDLAEAVILGSRVTGEHHGAARGDGALVQRQPDEAVRFGEPGLVPISVSLFEERCRDGRRVLSAGDAVGNLVLCVRLIKAHPDGDGQLRVVGGHPDIPVAAAHGDGARLAGDGRVGGEHACTRAAGDDGLKQRGHQIRVLLGDDAPAAAFVLIDHIAAGGYDPFYAVRLVIHAAVGVWHIGRCQLYGRDAVGHRAQCEGEVFVALLRGNAHPGQVLNRGVDADLIKKPYRRRVERIAHGGAHRHVAVIPVAGVSGRVAADEGRLFVQENRGRGIAFFKRRAVYGQRLERGAGLAAHLRRTVEAALDGVIPSADHGAHGAAVRVHDGHGALHGRAVGCTGRKQAAVRVHVVRNALQAAVKCRVDREAAADDLVRRQT